MLINIENIKSDDKNLPKITEIVHAFAKYEDVLEILINLHSFDENGYTPEKFILSVVTSKSEVIDPEIYDAIIDLSIDFEEKYPQITISLSYEGYEEIGIVLWTRKHHIHAIKSDDKYLAAVTDICNQLRQCQGIDLIYISERSFNENEYLRDNFTIYVLAATFDRAILQKIDALAENIEQTFPEVSIDVSVEYCDNGHVLILWP